MVTFSEMDKGRNMFIWENYKLSCVTLHLRCQSEIQAALKVGFTSVELKKDRIQKVKF